MAKKLPDHIQGVVDYLSDPSEKANEDLILKYFRKTWGSEFTRQKEAKNADGYVPGNFILELKGKKTDWLAGFFQGIAYSKELSFSMVIVATRNFLTIWNLNELDPKLIEEVISLQGAPNSIGKRLAMKYKHLSKKILNKAIWNLSIDFESELLAPNIGSIEKEFKNFEKTIKQGKKTRKKITTKNFTTILEEMKVFFNQDFPMSTLRAFYNMIFSWGENSVLDLSAKKPDQATVSGELIDNIIPGKRLRLKQFFEDHYIHLDSNQDIDDFFALYDKALDVVDKDFRIKNGIFFTDLDLSKFVMWFVKNNLGDIGKNHLVIDPACGSGNLVTNWKSPLELRHKVVSEIEPELLYTVEKRMKGDRWHNGKFTVVPKVKENKGLNFLDKSAEEYLEILSDYLEDRGEKPDKPIAFLCNPPYRSDDEQTAESINYQIHESITEVTGKDGSAERYSCFLAQMSNICKQAEDSGFPEDSLLLLFTKAAWLTNRPVFKKIREEIFGNFEDVSGCLFNGKEFFDLKGKFPIAFTIWRYKGSSANLKADREIELIDLTRVKKSDLKSIDWSSPSEVEERCKYILEEKDSIKVSIGKDRLNIKEWSNLTRFDFQREKRNSEKNDPKFQCGLPQGDLRHSRKKTLGECDGKYVGYMDDLTPCRINRYENGAVWFRLNNLFMNSRQTRCFSGPADNRSYYANDKESCFITFSWFALGRLFATEGYPMWADSEVMWPIHGTDINDEYFKRLIYSIGYAENECLETIFPANNPVKGAPEVYIANPMSPLVKDSLWNRVISKEFKLENDNASNLIKKINKFYKEWEKEVGRGYELHVDYKKAYFVGEGRLSLGAGLVQIKDFAKEMGNETLENIWREIAGSLKEVKLELQQKLLSKSELDYFGRAKSVSKVTTTKSNTEDVNFSPKTPFDFVLEKRLSLISKIIEKLPNDEKLNRVKIAKAVYLCDMYTDEDLKTNYVREAAGPLDQRFFYNEKIGVDILGKNLDLFTIEHKKLKKGDQFRYRAGKNIKSMSSKFEELFKDDAKKIDSILDLMSQMDSEQSEIFATVYACWNDLLLSKKKVTDKAIITEFLDKWHPDKTQYDEDRIISAIKWMKEKKIIPKGKPPRVNPKLFKEAIPF